MKYNKSLIIIGILLILILPMILAHTGEEIDESLPENIQKLIEYKHEQADFYLRNLSFLVAFLAGIVGLLTPCSLAILPAFFAYSFEGKKQITKMTLIFFSWIRPGFYCLWINSHFFRKKSIYVSAG